MHERRAALKGNYRAVHLLAKSGANLNAFDNWLVCTCLAACFVSFLFSVTRVHMPAHLCIRKWLLKTCCICTCRREYARSCT